MATLTAELNTLKGEILVVIKTRQFDRFKELTRYEDRLLNEIGSELGIERQEHQACDEYACFLYNNGLKDNEIYFYDAELFN